MRLCWTEVDEYFSNVVTYCDTREHKPSPKPFTMASEKMSIHPRNLLMVGDRIEKDIIGAKRLGMKTAFAHYGSIHRSNLHEADYILYNPKDVIQIVKNIDIEELI
jgi:putative hydrolase of the HAD superfamily